MITVVFVFEFFFIGCHPCGGDLFEVLFFFECLNFFGSDLLCLDSDLLDLDLGLSKCGLFDAVFFHLYRYL